MSPAHPAPGVLVVGGGFGGYYAAHALAHHHVPTTLIDANGFQTFQPMLYQAATGLMRPSDLEYPLERLKGVHHVTGRVESVSLDDATVTLQDGREFAAEYVVLATGAAVNFFGVPGAAEHAYPLYTAADARAIKWRLTELVVAGVPQRIVVVGAGATGVEVTGAISDVADHVLPRTFPDFQRASMELHIVDQAPQPLANMSAASQHYAEATLSGAGVTLHMGRRVTAVSATGVTLDDHSTLPADIAIWAGGLSVRLPQITPRPRLGHGGRVAIDAELRIPGYPNIYFIGDASADSQAPLPQLGSVAKQQGIHVGHSIQRQLAGDEPDSFVYKDMGDMAMIRHDAAVVEMGTQHHEVNGWTAYIMWLGLHAYLLPGDQHRVDAVRGWVHEQVTGKSQFLMD